MTIDISKHINKTATTFYINGKNQYRVVKENHTLYKRTGNTTTYYERDNEETVYSKGETASAIGYVISRNSDGTITWHPFGDSVTIHYYVSSKTRYTYKSIRVNNYDALQAADYAYIPEEFEVTTNTITFEGTNSVQGNTIDLGTH